MPDAKLIKRRILKYVGLMGVIVTAIGLITPFVIAKMVARQQAVDNFVTAVGVLETAAKTGNFTHGGILDCHSHAVSAARKLKQGDFINSRLYATVTNDLWQMFVIVNKENSGPQPSQSQPIAENLINLVHFKWWDFGRIRE